jgi:hypothetical protein
MIKLCPNCKPHEFQDKTYGKNMRVFNPMRKSNSSAIVGFRCTVCCYETKDITKTDDKKGEK